MRRGTRFCRPACRVNHHLKTRPAPRLTDDVRLSHVEAGLLIDAAAPWFPGGSGSRPSSRHPFWYSANGKTPAPEAIEEWRRYNRDVARARRVQRAWRRLVALGLVRVGKSGTQTVIERTPIGSALLKRRHNELHATAERGCGRLASQSAAELVWWRQPAGTSGGIDPGAHLPSCVTKNARAKASRPGPKW
jgi:hypothetical protein